MSDIKTDEVYWLGFEETATVPYYWIRLPQPYFRHTLHSLEYHSQDIPGARAYLGHGSQFCIGRDNRFGFGRVGTMAACGKDEVILRIHLRGRVYNQRTLLTLHLLLLWLNAHRLDDGCWVGGPTRQQVLELYPHAEHVPKGHAISGTIYPHAVALLASGRLGKTVPGVNRAMQRTWHMVADREYRPYADESGIGFHSDGRPELTCFGFGITSAVTPEASFADGARQISSDNVDAAYQALTFLAGWFKLAHVLRQHLRGFS